jgi:uncharacterized membrane protein YqaE (UPF0057 family)
MQRKFFHLRNAVLILALGFTSCSRNYHVEYSGHYKPRNKMDVSASAQQEEPVKLPAPAMESLTASVNEEPALQRIELPKQANYTMHHQVFSSNTASTGQKGVKSEKRSSVGQTHTDYFSTEGNRQGLKRASSNDSKALYCLLAIFIPPLAVALWEDGITAHFWWDCVFTLLFWVPGIIYAWIIII